MTNAIEIEGLAKTYSARGRSIAAIDGLDLAVPQGGVFGFLGANGAGKTTTIRALVGHLRASKGTMRMLGTEVPSGLPSVIDRVGALVEQPSFFNPFSGRRNLTLLARSRGFPLSQVDAALETVGLTERADSRVATYSLGMRQRLGVAAVLLKDPELLILDEPANGLDPPGILEMRTLLQRLGAEGRTVFVSSHILSEIEQTCDRVGIIARGRTITTGSVRDILATTVSQFRVRVPGGAPERDGAATVLQQASMQVLADAHGEMLVQITPDRAHDITRLLSGAGIYVSELTPIGRSLEEAFLELTEGQN